MTITSVYLPLCNIFTDFVKEIEIYNPNFNNSMVEELDLVKNIIYNLDCLGRPVDLSHTGFIFNVYDNGSVDKKYIISQ